MCVVLEEKEPLSAGHFAGDIAVVRPQAVPATKVSLPCWARHRWCQEQQTEVKRYQVEKGVVEAKDGDTSSPAIREASRDVQGRGSTVLLA
jgi:hypothetical protein